MPPPTTKTTQGKTVSFAKGKLKVSKKKATTKYIVNGSTDCGCSLSMSGNSMPCSSLKKKYLKKKVVITWHSNSKGKRVADVVPVQLQ